jgi:hypothetical protein
VANRDDLLTLATMAMLCFFWFHPMAHWAYRRVRMNNELCCDEDVVRSGVQPTDYVDTLMSIVAGSFSRRGFSMHILGDASPAGVLRKRLQYILRERTCGEPRPIWAYAALLLVLVTMPRFLGQGSLVEVLMRNGQHLLLTRAELHEMGPALVSRVLTPGVVDDAWYQHPAVFADAATTTPAAQGLGSFLSETLGLTAAAQQGEGAAPPDLQGGKILADVTDEVAAASDSTGDAPAPARKSRGSGWGTGTPVGDSAASQPILPPPSDRP